MRLSEYKSNIGKVTSGTPKYGGGIDNPKRGNQKNIYIIMFFIMPSYKSSTLSLMLVYWIASLPILWILAGFIAVFAPQWYEFMSQEKLLVSIILGAYLVAGMQLLGAYLQRSQNNTIPKENKEPAGQTQEEAELQFISEKYKDGNNNK